MFINLATKPAISYQLGAWLSLETSRRFFPKSPYTTQRQLSSLDMGRVLYFAVNGIFPTNLICWNLSSELIRDDFHIPGDANQVIVAIGDTTEFCFLSEFIRGNLEIKQFTSCFSQLIPHLPVEKQNLKISDIPAYLQDRMFDMELKTTWIRFQDNKEALDSLKIF